MKQIDRSSLRKSVKIKNPAIDHLAGIQYEQLIMKVFHYSPEEKGIHSATAGYFQNCFRLERGEKISSLKTTFEEQFSVVKKHIIVALQELQDKTASPEKLKSFEDNIRECKTTACLVEQINFILLFLSNGE